ncbi:MAG: tetratricopeptide repeat protein, partial [Gammaproteobacteria bacterium]|nr:tetratricopeptide repeat protein [Gammaproteobacteria bacterium]NNJ73000.1 tetratricopeptide repeat protein [Enterobacterales bacterium]
MGSDDRRRKQTYRIDSSLRAGFRLNDVVVLPQNGTIIAQETEKNLSPKAMEVLLYLCQNRNRLVTTESLLSFGWGDTNANRSNLTHVISDIRRVLNDHKESPTFIQTMPRKGYRLIAKISDKDDLVTHSKTGQEQVLPESSATEQETDHKTWHYSLAILKNSKLFSVSMGFMISIWFLIQIFDIIFPIMNVPEWGLQVAVLILVVGLPLALLFTWLKEIKFKKLLFSKQTADRKYFFRQLAVDFTFIGVISLAVGWLSFFLVESIEREVVITDNVFDFTMTVPVQNELIAVLPFRFQEQSNLPIYFKSTFQGELILALSNQEYFKLVSERAINELNEDFTMNDVLRRLGARYIIDGQVIDDGTNATVIVNIIDTESSITAWNARIQKNISQILELQKEVYRQTFNAMALIADQPADDFVFINTNDFKAYDSYIQGKNILANTTNSQELEQAQLHFLNALQLDTDFSQAKAGLCQTYLDTYEQTLNINSFDLATEHCASLTGNEQLKAEGYIALGNLYRLSGDHSLAIDNYNAALEISLDALDAVRGLAKSKIAMSEYKLAGGFYRQLIRREPGYWRNYLEYGDFLFTIGNYENASKQYEKATLLRPNDALVASSLGAAYYMNLDWEKAAKALERSITIFPNPESYSNLGTAQFFSANYSDAIKNYQAAVELSSDNPMFWSNLGDAQKYAGLKEESKATYNKAYDLVNEHMKVNPNDHVLLGISTRLESELNMCDKAQERISELTSQERDDPY